MPSYFAIVHKDEDSAYGISFPDLEGCYSAADTEDDIVSQAQEALALYLDDVAEIPRSSSIAELRRDPDVKKDLASGAFLIAVPLVLTSQKARYNVVLETSLVEAVDKAARAGGLSRSEFFARAASRSLEETSGLVFQSLRKRRSSKGGKPTKASALTQKAKKK